MRVLDLKPGLYADVAEADYHLRVPGLVNKSALDQVDRSPKHYEAWLKGAEREETEALAFGKALHMALLEPDEYMRVYTVQPDFGDGRFKEAKEKKRVWMLENAGKKPISADDSAAILGMFKAVRAHPLAKLMIAEGRPELTLRWKDEETGLECKARGDYYVERNAVCYDVKTTQDARARAFSRSVADYGYHRQNAFYADGFRSIGAPLRHFIFVAIEKTAPYCISLFHLDERGIAKGYDSIRRNMTTLRDCIEKGDYPGYETGIQTLELPTWAF